MRPDRGGADTPAAAVARYGTALRDLIDAADGALAATSAAARRAVGGSLTPADLAEGEDLPAEALAADAAVFTSAFGAAAVTATAEATRALESYARVVAEQESALAAARSAAAGVGSALPPAADYLRGLGERIGEVADALPPAAGYLRGLGERIGEVADVLSGMALHLAGEGA